VFSWMMYLEKASKKAKEIELICVVILIDVRGLFTCLKQIFFVKLTPKRDFLGKLSVSVGLNQDRSVGFR
jgi:hypothetical protein